MKNAMTSLIERGILIKTGKYVELNETFSEDEGKLVELLQLIGKFRQKPRTGDKLTLGYVAEDSTMLRRSIMA